METLTLERPALGGGGFQMGTTARLLQWVLLGVLFGIYCGAMPYLLLISFSLLYGVYMVIGGSAAGIVADRWQASRGLKSVAPYVCWLVFYFYWGTVVAPENLKLSDVAKTFLKNALVFTAVCMAISDRIQLRRFATLVQLAVLMNVAVAVYEYRNPELIPKLAFLTNPDTTAFSVTRPAGLWSNPNEAAFAYLFGILLSFWAAKPISWFGLVGGLAGLFLGSSRTGAYVLMLCAMVGLLATFQRQRLKPAKIGAICLLLIPFLIAVPKALDLVASKASGVPQIERMLDAAGDSGSSGADSSRFGVALDAWNQIVEGPWYGYGIFMFQNSEHSPTPGVLEVAAHNIYLAVLGEGGAFCLLSYLAVLGAGLWRVTKVQGRDRLLLSLMWMSYLIIGMTWHNQFTAFAGMIYVGLLFHLPVLLRGHAVAAK